MIAQQEYATHNSTAKKRPALRPRVEGVSVGKTGIRSPHDLLKLQELGQETRKLVVCALGLGAHYTGGKVSLVVQDH